MESLPAGWPLDPGAVEAREVPLFPLSGVYLVPGAFMPLHVFEPRYRQMVEDSLDGPGRIAMGTVLPGYESEMTGAPPVHHVAGVGEIVKHQRFKDGRFLIVLFGLVRARLRESPSDRLYRKVLAEPLHDVPPSSAVDRELRGALIEAVTARHADAPQIPERMPIGNLADLLLLQLKLPGPRMLEIYSLQEAAARARAVLAEHSERPLDPPEPGGESGREIV